MIITISNESQNIPHQGWFINSFQTKYRHEQKHTTKWPSQTLAKATAQPASCRTWSTSHRPRPATCALCMSGRPSTKLGLQGWIHWSMIRVLPCRRHASEPVDLAKPTWVENVGTAVLATRIWDGKTATARSYWHQLYRLYYGDFQGWKFRFGPSRRIDLFWGKGSRSYNRRFWCIFLFNPSQWLSLNFSLSLSLNRWIYSSRFATRTARTQRIG